MKSKIPQRLRWVELKANGTDLVCRRRGISRPTLRMWVRRYRESGKDCLADRSGRPTTSPPAAKVFDKPAAPHLNGKVERSQRTDLEEFWATADLSSPNLEKQLDNWQVYYDEFRPHGSLREQTPSRS